MKFFIFLFLSVTNLFALDVIISDPCSSTPLINTQVVLSHNLSVGELTVNLLAKHNLEFEGSEAGIISINQTPKSLEAIELLGENSLRSHGWCYTLNEKLSSLLSDEQMLTAQDRKLFWYYGYFLMDQGKWGGDCLPAEMSFLESFCSWSK
jgi:hypothetical protein